ncbi:MAG TPA: hypothetical protein VFZ53_08950 [Polyangiaceae bacterium]
MRRWVLGFLTTFALASACGGRSITTRDDGSESGGSRASSGGGTGGRGGIASGAVSGSGGHSGSVGFGGGKSLPPVVGGESGTAPIGTGGAASTGGSAGGGGGSRVGTGGAPGCDTERVVTGFTSVPTQQGLEELHGVTRVDGTLILEGSVFSLEPLRCLGSVSESLHLADMPLASLHSLENLRSVGGDLVFEVTVVPDVEPLRGLRTVGGNLELIWNLRMTSLAGLHELDWVGADVVIEGNDRLPTCEAERLITAVGRENIAGTVRIAGNGGEGACE